MQLLHRLIPARINWYKYSLTSLILKESIAISLIVINNN